MLLSCKRRIILFLLSLVIASVETQVIPLQCMSRRFPKMIGADSGDTTIERIQLDSHGNMAIGGKSTDSNFISTATAANEQSFAALLLNPTFDYLWAVAFNIYNQDMRDMQFRPGSEDEIMIFIGHYSALNPTNLFIISSMTGAMMKQASIYPGNLEARGRAFFSSLGQIFFISTSSAYYPMFSLLDLTSATTTFTFKKLNTNAGSAFTLIEGKQSLGCFYASVDLDAGGLQSLGFPLLSYGMIKLTAAGPSQAWYYFVENLYLIPHNQEYFDVQGGGGALFTIGRQATGYLLITRTHLNNNGDPTSTDSYKYYETGGALRNLHIRIKNYNQMVGLFTGNGQTFILTITFNDPNNPTASPPVGSLQIQQTMIVQPVFIPPFIKLGILENMPAGSTTQEFFITGIKVGTDQCKATFPLAGAGFISYSKSNENCGQNTQFSASATTIQPLVSSISFKKYNMPAGSQTTATQSFHRTRLTAINIPIQKLYLVEPACCNTLLTTPVSTEILNIGFGPLLIPVPFFTVSESCTESTFVFTYSLTAATKNGAAISVPAFFVLDTLSLAHLQKIIVQVTTTNPSDIGTYVLSLKGELPNHQTIILQIQVIIVTDPIIPSRIPDLTYIIGQPLVIQYNSYFLSTNPNLVRLYSIYQDGNLGYDAQIITYRPINSTIFSIKVYSQNDTKIGLYRMEIRAKYSLHSQYEVRSSFQILILERCKAALILSSPIKNITIKVDSVPQNPLFIQTFPSWTDSVGGGKCNPIKYQLKMQNEDNLPKNIRFQKQNLKLIINYMNILTVKSGIYPLTLKGSNKYFQWAKLDFSVTIKCFTQFLKPTFQSQNLTYDIGSGLQKFQLPQFEQSPIQCEDEVSYSAFQFPSFQNLPDFISFYRDTEVQKLIFIVNAFQNDDRIASGMIIQIVIIGNLTLQSGNLVTTQQNLQIRFMNKTENNQDQKGIHAKISKITSNGQVTILFSKDMKVPVNLTLINQDSLRIKLFDSENYQISIIKLNWTVLSFEKRYLKLQLEFNDTIQVSNQKPWDNLTIQVLDPEPFKSQQILNNKFETIRVSKDFFMSSLIPPQIDPNSSFNQFIEKNEDIMKGVLAMNQIIFYILSFSLQMLWGMINSLQLVLLLPLVNIWFPSNAQILFQMLFQVFNFEFFDSNQLFKYLMPFFLKEEDFEQNTAKIDFPLNEQFELNGYSSVSSVLNLGSMFFYALGILFINIILGIFNLLMRFVKKQVKLVNYLSRIVFHNMLIRFLIESYIQILICAHINFSKFEVQGNLGDSFSSIFAILILAFGFLLIIINIFIHRLLLKQDNSQQNLEAYSAFFESQKHPFPSAIDYTTWYLLRRFFFSTIIVQLTHYPSLQLILLTIQGLATLIYIVTVHPFEDRLTNRMEIFNESCLLLAITNLYAFVREGEDEMKRWAGWSIIGIVATQLAVNTLIMVGVSIKEGWLKLKRAIMRWKQRRERELLEKEKAAEQVTLKTSENLQENVQAQVNEPNEIEQDLRESLKNKNEIKQFSTDDDVDKMTQAYYELQRQKDLISLKPSKMLLRPPQKYEYFQATKNLENQSNISQKFISNNLIETSNKLEQLQSNLNMDFSDILKQIRQGSEIKQTSHDEEDKEDKSRASNIIIIPTFEAQLSQIKKNS